MNASKNSEISAIERRYYIELRALHEVMQEPPTFLGPTTKSQERVIIELLKRRRLSRSDVDRIAGCTNGPDVMAQLSRRGLTKGRRGQIDASVCVASHDYPVTNQEDPSSSLAGCYTLTWLGVLVLEGWLLRYFTEGDEEGDAPASCGPQGRNGVGA